MNIFKGTPGNDFYDYSDGTESLSLSNSLDSPQSLPQRGGWLCVLGWLLSFH